MGLLWVILADSALGAAPPPIVGGTPEENGAVVLLVVSDQNGDATAVCSGSRLDPWTILTAAHCVLPGAGFVPARVQVVAAESRSAATGGNTVDAEDWWVHPDYDEATATFDVALLRLSEASDGEQLPLLRDAPREADLGDPVELVGFGAVGDQDANADPTRRSARAPLYDFDDAALFTWDDAGVVNACFGDSGGAMLVPAEDGRLALAGVIGFVSLCEGGSTGGARSDQILPWIRETATPEEAERPPVEAEDTGIHPPGECACGGGAAGPLGWGLAGLFAVGRGRRRTR